MTESTTQFESIFNASFENDGFYVPQFEVQIEGVGLPRNVLRDVMEITYKDNIKEIDGFELTVNNWDPSANKFKYVGSETTETLEGNSEDSQLHKLFEPCSHEVKIFMGYAGNMQHIMDGNFTTLAPNFPSSGGPTLTVSGLNVLHSLRRKQHTHAWSNKTDSKIAQNLATLTDKKDRKKRLPIPERISRLVTNEQDDEPELTYVTQRNQYDIDFLFRRARERGYVLVLQPDPNDSTKPPFLYFGPPDSDDARSIPLNYELEWGKSLIDFKPTLKTANQVSSVTVKGWDRRRNKPISEKKTLDDCVKKNKDLHRLLQQCDAREEIVVDKPVFSKGEAERMACDILKNRQREMVTTSATVVGLPGLRAGSKVLIKKLGKRFSGEYFVTETTHTINSSGYITKFKARREHNGEVNSGGVAA